MAYTSVIPVRRLDRAVKYVMNKEKTTAVSLQDALDYAANRDKTEQSCFESSYACTLETAFADMRQTKERWHKLGGVQGYHLVQSFAVGEVTPELAHQIAKELTDRVLGGRYEYVIGTHLNTGHIHSHIVWNTVSCVDGKKYRSNYKSYVTEIRAVSDELCRKYKLSVIDTETSHHVAKPYAEWLAEKNGQPTWRTAIRQDVDEAIQQSLTWRQFLSVLERKGYEVRRGRKYPVLRPPGKERFVRFKTLGKRYTPEAIQTRILYPRSYCPYVENPPTIQRARLRDNSKPRRKLTGLRALYYRYLYELGALPRKPRRPSYAVRQDAYKLDQRIRQMEFLSKNNIDTLAQLETYRLAKLGDIVQLTAQRKSLYARWQSYRNKANFPKMVAAACIINDGSSDDRFTDFRNWLIMQGYDAYRQALIDPDNLAALNIPFRDTEWMGCGNVAWYAYAGQQLHTYFEKEEIAAKLFRKYPALLKSSADLHQAIMQEQLAPHRAQETEWERQMLRTEVKHYIDTSGLAYSYNEFYTQNMPDKVAWKTLQSDLFANLPQIKAERMPQDFSAVLPKLWRKRQAWDTERTKRPPYRGEER